MSLIESCISILQSDYQKRSWRDYADKQIGVDDRMALRDDEAAPTLNLNRVFDMSARWGASALVPDFHLLPSGDMMYWAFCYFYIGGLLRVYCVAVASTWTRTKLLE